MAYEFHVFLHSAFLLRGVREVGNDLRTEQANRLQHVPLLAHGWPKQDMRGAQTLGAVPR